MGKYSKYIKYILFLIITILIEVMIFNITSFRVLLGDYQVVTYYPIDENITHENDKTIYVFEDIEREVGTIKLNLKEDINYDNFEYKISFSDESSSSLIELTAKNYIVGNERSLYIPTYFSGNTHELKVEVSENLEIDSITLNKSIPINLNLFRMLIIFSLILFCYNFKNSKLLNENYSKINSNHEMCLLIVLFLAIFITTYINHYSSLNNNVDNTMYNEWFVNSIENGHLYLLELPTEKFLNIENPYDGNSRIEAGVLRGIDYLWDTAYYNGHFYVYFGILPLLILFLPYHLLTKTYLSTAMGCLLFSILIYWVLKELFCKIIGKFFDEKIKLKYIILLLAILLLGTLIPYANGMSRVYEIAILSGVYFSIQGLYFIFNSYLNQENINKRNKYLFLGSLFLALAVACRPIDLFVSLIIVPYLISIFINYINKLKISEKENKREIIINLIKFILVIAIPYLAIGILLMIYNYLRFDNVFEFGTSYQITVANMQELESRIFTIFPGIIANLFQFPHIINQFPFINLDGSVLTFYGYYYVESIYLGVFIASPICFIIFNIYNILKKNINKEFNVMTISFLVTGLIIAILSVVMAGSTERYLVDYAWIFNLLAIFLFIKSYIDLNESKPAQKIMKKALIVITIVTIFLGISSGILSEKDYFKRFNPNEYYKLESSICFWE